MCNSGMVRNSSIHSILVYVNEMMKTTHLISVNYIHISANRSVGICGIIVLLKHVVS